jgi:hypothetical protein
VNRLPLLAALLLAVPATADEPRDSFKKVEKGAGQLLEAIGQEAKKAGDTIAKGVKKTAKKDEAKK